MYHKVNTVCSKPFNSEEIIVSIKDRAEDLKENAKESNDG